MLRIAIVEDDPGCSRQLEEYLSRYQTEKSTDICRDVFANGAEIIRQYKPVYDIIFLDIQMPYMDGMEAAAAIRARDERVTLVFITNIAEYAIKGYKVGAMEYLLKPVSYFAFCQCLDKAVRQLEKQQASHIVLHVKGGRIRVPVSDIYYVESVGHQLYIHRSGDTLVSSTTMSTMEEQLAGYDFVRGNKCYLINLAWVEEINGRDVTVHGERLQLSRPRRTAFMKALTAYWGERS